MAIRRDTGSTIGASFWQTDTAATSRNGQRRTFRFIILELERIEVGEKFTLDNSNEFGIFLKMYAEKKKAKKYILLFRGYPSYPWLSTNHIH